MKNVKKNILIGSGGHALSILELNTIETRNIIGYSDIKEKRDFPIPFVGSDAKILGDFPNTDYCVILGVVYTDTVDLSVRMKLISKFNKYDSPIIFAQSSLVTRHCIIGKGTIFFEKSFVNVSSMGEYCVINSGAIIEHCCRIGNNVFIGPGAVIGGGVDVGNNVFIGSGAIIRDDVSIPDNVIIGMGGIVTHSIEKEGKYYGNPAKYVGK